MPFCFEKCPGLKRFYMNLRDGSALHNERNKIFVFGCKIKWNKDRILKPTTSHKSYIFAGKE